MKNSGVLHYLRQGGSQAISGEEISRKLKVSRSAVWKEIQQLRALGYQIEAVPHLGYRLLKAPDRMFADEIQHGLSTQWLGKRILSYESLDSTNDAVFKLGEQGVPEGTCVFAEHQKKGRGRLGRSWMSPKHQAILLSVLLRPRLAPSQISKVTLLAAVSTAKAVQGMIGKRLEIKWPNDLFFEGKKVGGILTEMSAETDQVKFIVLGIGINVNTDAKDLPPEGTSLKEMLGSEISRIDLARAMLVSLEEDINVMKSGDFKKIARQWEEFSVTLGKRVVVMFAHHKIYGTATSIDEEGALWVRKDNGLQERILSGDIQHIR